LTKQELAAFRVRLIDAIQGLERKLKRRVTQTELAERWVVSQGSVSQWLAGKAMPEDREIVRRIAKDCGRDPGWLDWGTLPAPPSENVPKSGTGDELKEG